MSTDHIISAAVMLWAVIDPIGTVLIFISVTKGRTPPEMRKIAFIASLIRRRHSSLHHHSRRDRLEGNGRSVGCVSDRGWPDSFSLRANDDLW